IFANPSVELDSYSVKRYEDTVIIMGEVKGKNIKGLVIIDRTVKNKKRVITASEARLEANPEQRGAISLRLENVFTHVTDPGEKGSYEYGSARSMIYNILLKDISISLVSPGPAEMSSSDVWREIEARDKQFRERLDTKEETIKKLRFALNMEVRAALQAAGETITPLSPEKEAELVRSVKELKKEEEKPVLDRNLQRYLLEFQRKFSSPFSCFVFILFAFPVGLLARRSGRALGFGVGIVMSGIYWGMLLISYRFGSSMSFSPVLSMWAPNLFVLAAGLILIARKVRT
ncbi:MAG TPA: LptF/LptG family permease, partial [Spirochaetia bacterium]|nr:LptF/LptG family permease [Spirochaetia bacterium]